MIGPGVWSEGARHFQSQAHSGSAHIHAVLTFQSRIAAGKKERGRADWHELHSAFLFAALARSFAHVQQYMGKSTVHTGIQHSLAA